MAKRSENDALPGDTLVISEVFRSIQGESTWAGLPCTFVRLAGCHLRCTYCDTRYAYTGGTDMTVAAVLDRCAELGGGLVEVTGGEPLLQAACPDLVARLLECGYTVLVETSGTVPVGALSPGAIKIMDFKCPSSGVCDQNDWTNISALTSRDEVKFVIGDRADYKWSRDVVQQYDLARRCKQVLFSPIFGVIEPRVIAEWILEDHLEVRFQLQLHKYIWPPGQRGV